MYIKTNEEEVDTNNSEYLEQNCKKNPERNVLIG